MKKIVLLILLILCTFQINAKEGFISGTVYKKNYNKHDLIKIILLDNNKEIIDTSYTKFNGNFYFYNIKNGNYILNIENENTKLSINITKSSDNLNLEAIKIKESDINFSMYIFSHIISLCVIIINIFMIFFIVKSSTKIEKKSIALAIGSVTVWFGIEIGRFCIGFVNEELASRIWILPHLGTIFSGVFIYWFFNCFPVKAITTLKKGIIVLSTIIQTILLCVISVWLYAGSDEQYKSIMGFNVNNAITAYQLVMIILLLFTIINLASNSIKYKNQVESELSIYFIKKIILLSLVIVIGGIGVFTFWHEMFNGYYNLVLSIIDIYFFWSILIVAFGIRFLKDYDKISRVFLELYKYLIIFIIFYITLSITSMNQIGSILYIIGLKIFIDYIGNLVYKKIEIKYDWLIKNLIAVNKISDFNEKLEKGLKKILMVEKVFLYSRNEMDEKNNTIFLRLEESEDNIVGNKSLSEFKEFDGFELGVKVKFEKRINGIILLGKKEKGSVYGRNEIEFLISFSSDIAIILKNILVENMKRDLMSTEKSGHSLKKVKEYFAYSKKILTMIKDKSEKKEIAEICDILLEESEQIVNKLEVSPNEQ